MAAIRKLEGRRRRAAGGQNQSFEVQLITHAADANIPHARSVALHIGWAFAYIELDQAIRWRQLTGETEMTTTRASRNGTTKSARLMAAISFMVMVGMGYTISLPVEGAIGSAAAAQQDITEPEFL